jgi:hypothetical protein
MNPKRHTRKMKMSIVMTSYSFGRFMFRLAVLAERFDFIFFVQFFIGIPLMIKL